MRLGGFFVGQMKRLRIVFPGELDHFVARDEILTEPRRGADFDVLEILQTVAHRAIAARNGMSSPSRFCPAGKPSRSRNSGATSTLSKVGSLPSGRIAGPLA